MITQKTFYRKIKPYSDHGLYILLLLLSLVLLSTVTSCQKTHVASPQTCSTLATISDLRGLDGCEFVLEPDNGEKSEPYWSDIVE